MSSPSSPANPHHTVDASARDYPLDFGPLLSPVAYPLDVITMPEEWEGWEGIHDFHVGTVNGVPCRIVRGNDDKPRAGRRLRDAALAEIDTCTLRLAPAETFTRVLPQPVEEVANHRVFIPADAYARLPKAELYLVACPATGCSFTVHREELFPYSGDKRVGIKLSRYQRLLLRINPPMELTRSTMKQLGQLQADGTFTEEDAQLLARTYDCWNAERGLWDRVGELDYADSRRIMAMLNAIGFSTIVVTALTPDLLPQGSADSRPPLARRAWYKVAQAYVGSRRYQLRTIRPLDIDESRTAVRLSADTMTMLGLEPLDRVILRYRGKVATARAMEIESPEEMRINSHLGNEESLDVIVGIPVSLRRELGVGGLGECVTVERDANHMLQKTLNVQLLAAVTWLFTLVQVAPLVNLSIAWLTVTFIAILPLALYIGMAGQRSQVD